MSFRLSDTERTQLRKYVARPRNKKQFYRAKALLALDSGIPIETVARQLGVGSEKIDDWARKFSSLGLKFLKEQNARPPRDPDDEPDDE